MGTIYKIAWVRVRRRRMLFVRSKGKGLFYSPGGKRKGNETDVEALVREIGEELGVRIIPETVKYLETFRGQSHGESEGTSVEIACYTAQCVGEPHAASEIEEIAWLSSADGKRTTAAGRLILNWLAGRGLID